ncbi:AGE family epimerase/isomerase [Pseudomonas sp. Marseille-QA0332]
MPALQPDVISQLARFARHFSDTIVPLWQGPGWNAEMALPYEALDEQHKPLPVQRYRAMACARQLYLFSSRIGEPGAAERAAALFRSLGQHFHDQRQGGWFYSIDAQGRPLDRRKDLYTHAFIVFACAHYWGKVQERLVESTLDTALGIVARRFARADGLYEASLAEDWSDLASGPLQNPQMHLAEALLQTHAVRPERNVERALLQLCEALQRHFVDPRSGVMLEKPRGTAGNWFEPGHQFEWFFLLDTSPLLRGTSLHASIARGFEHAEQTGVRDAAVLAMLDTDDKVLDASQRIWAQAEYVRALALRPDSQAKLSRQLQALQARFLQPAGWHECLDANGKLSRPDMPSTTPYHLATCLEGLRRLEGA